MRLKDIPGKFTVNPKFSTKGRITNYKHGLYKSFAYGSILSNEIANLKDVLENTLRKTKLPEYKEASYPSRIAEVLEAKFLPISILNSKLDRNKKLNCSGDRNRGHLI